MAESTNVCNTSKRYWSSTNGVSGRTHTRRVNTGSTHNLTCAQCETIPFVPLLQAPQLPDLLLGALRHRPCNSGRPKCKTCIDKNLTCVYRPRRGHPDYKNLKPLSSAEPDVFTQLLASRETLGAAASTLSARLAPEPSNNMSISGASVDILVPSTTRSIPSGSPEYPVVNESPVATTSSAHAVKDKRWQGRQPNSHEENAFMWTSSSQGFLVEGNGSLSQFISL